MKLIRTLLKPLSFLPALCLMYMIYTFSAQDGAASSQLSYKVSYKIVETGGLLLGEHLEPWEIDSIATRFHGIVRKLAHMTEYFALAVSVAFPLYVYGLRGFLLMLAAGFLCVAFACGDEYHQSLVAGRSPSKRDVLIDSFGIFWGIVLVRIVGWTGRKTIFRPLSRDTKKKKKMSDGAYQNPPYPTGGTYQNPPYPAGGTYQNPSYPQGDPYSNASYPPNAAYPQGGGYPPYYGNAPFDPTVSEEHHVSDRLSEDMSFRKLMQDLKEQKTEARQESRTAPKKKPVRKETVELDIDEIDLDD